jgi:hypothetical protein
VNSVLKIFAYSNVQIIVAKYPVIFQINFLQVLNSESGRVMFKGSKINFPSASKKVAG